MIWTQFFTLYAIALPVFFMIDLLWIGVVANSLYRSRLGEWMQISWAPALAFYFIFLLGVTYYATYPTVNDGWMAAAGAGALFGFFTYATYGLTNQATLKGWPLDMMLIDLVWGTVLGASVAAVTVGIYSLFA